MDSLDRWLTGGNDKLETKSAIVRCLIWGKIYHIVRAFTVLRVIDRVKCQIDRYGYWWVEVAGRYSRGVATRIVFWYHPNYGLSVPRERRRKKESERGWITQPVADALYELAAKHSVELDKEGRIYIDGVEVDMWSCASRGAVDFECVLRQVTERRKSHPRILR